MARQRRFVSAALLPAGLLCLTAFASGSNAREPLPPADGDVQVLADEAGRGPATREDQRRRANDDDWFRARPRDAVDGGAADFPSAEVHDAVVANARAAGARSEFRRAESTLATAVRVAQQSAQASAALREAVAAEQRAYENYDAARREALRDLVGDAKYQAMEDLRQNLTRQIVDRRESADELYDRSARVRLVAAGHAVDPGTSESVVAMASLKMRVGSDARAMEREALANNDRVRKAQQDYAAASARVAALRADADRKVREDAGVKNAIASLEDARTNRVVAETYCRGADLAAGRALDFAYFTHRYDYYRYNHNGYGYPYASFGLGYGYSARGFRSIP